MRPTKHIRGICPKCGQVGIQVIKIPNRKYPNAKQMRYYHGERYCYIGRVRTTEEALGELDKPQSTEEYEKALAKINSELKDLIQHYSSSQIGSVKKIVRHLRAITEKFSY